jgi:hypothetical protein
VRFIDESGTHRGAQKRVQAMQLTLCFSGALEISPKRCTAQRRKRRFRVAHAATRLTVRKLRSTMQVGRLDVMSNVVSASSLLVHRNEDAENSFSVEPNDVDNLRAAALRDALPEGPVQNVETSTWKSGIFHMENWKVVQNVEFSTFPSFFPQTKVEKIMKCGNFHIFLFFGE